MRRDWLEKSLKRFLKRKVSYTLSLLVTFLITGGIVEGETISQIKLDSSRKMLLNHINAERAKIKRKIALNEKKLKEIKKEDMQLLKEADWWSKTIENAVAVSFIVGKKDVDSISKHWEKSIRKDTDMDKRREKFDGVQPLRPYAKNKTLLDAVQYTQDKREKQFLSSGWINATEGYNQNTNVYDNIAELMILPVVKPPEVLSPATPKVSFKVPKAPTVVAVDSPNIAGITVGNIAVPNVSIQAPTPQTPLNIQAPTISNISVVVPPVTVTGPTQPSMPQAPTFSINPPKPVVALTVKEPSKIVEPNVPDPKRELKIVEPNTDPFSDFGWNWIDKSNDHYYAYDKSVATDPNYKNPNPLIQNYDNITGGTFWSGVAKDSTTGKVVIKDNSGASNISATSAAVGGQSATTETGLNIAERDSRRNTAISIYYENKDHKTANVSGVNIYVAGSETPIQAHYQGVATNVKGTSAIHLVGRADISNSHFYLYGKSAVVNMEAWRAPQLKITTSDIHVEGDNNAVFNFQGRPFGFENYADGSYAAKADVTADINISTKNNSIFAIGGYAPGTTIKYSKTNTGLNIDGASNIVVSDLGYVTDKSKYLGTTGAPARPTEAGYNSPDYGKPLMKIGDSTKGDFVNQYGDENVTLFFNTSREIDVNGTKVTKGNIGIYQGDVEVNAKIGEKLSTAGGSTQIDTGNIHGSNPGLVERNVGVYAKSGQRDGIIPSTDLGAMSFNDLDKIQSLNIGKFDIRFGEKSKDGFMFISQLGTVMDVGKNMTTGFSDGIDGATTADTKASTGTVIAYSEGTWNGTTHRITGSSLEGKGSEINIYAPLTMISKEGIAFLGNNNGIVTMNADTEAKGIKSIVGYALDSGKVNVKGSVKAVKGYENIGGYALNSGSTTTTKGGEVTFDKKVEVHGIGAFAKGDGSKVTLKATDNELQTGDNPTLVALDKGFVDFKGGTIVHKDINPGDHKGKLAFYAKDGGKINFSGATTLNIFDGAVFSGKKSEYEKDDYSTASAAGKTSAKYYGMKNLTVSLQKDNIDLGVFKGENITWSGASAYNTTIGGLLAGVTIQNNNHSYNTYLEGGKFDINSNVNLGSTATNDDKIFNSIVLEREKVGIKNGVTVKSTTGKGLVLASNATANMNTESGYTNDGTIDISGGSSNQNVGVYTTFGYIDNKGKIKVDKGIGIAGVNGSKLTNESTGTIQVNGNKAVGIAGLGRRVDSTGKVASKEGFGTDAGKTGNVIEIQNRGSINISGTDSVGVYANNNVNVAKNKVIVENAHELSMLGDRSVGVMVEGTQGGTINLTKTTTEDIKVGKSGIGVYGDNSDITFKGGSPYGINIKDNGIGILAKNNSTITNGSLKVNYSGASNASGTAIVYDGKANPINNTEIELGSSTANMTGTLSGIYAKNSTGVLTNNKNIKITTQNANGYGIIGEKLDIKNNAVIETKGGTDIYAKDGGVETAGDKIKILGSGAKGIFAVSDNLTSAKTIKVTQGTSSLKVDGTKGIGIYLKDKQNNKLILDNSSKVELTPSSSSGDRRIGVFLETATNTSNINKGDLLVTGNASSGNNVGIYMKDSYLKNQSKIDVNGIDNIGIYSESSNSNKLDLGTSSINVATANDNSNDKSIGVYAKGKNQLIKLNNNNIISKANSIGLYLDGDKTSKTDGNMNITLEAKNNGALGIGAYYKGGALANTGAITVKNNTNTTIRPIGVYYADKSSENKADILLTGNNDLIGMYVANTGVPFVNTGDIKVNTTTKGIGGYFTGVDVNNKGDVNVASNTGYGMYFTNGNSINSGKVTISGDKGIGVIASGSNTTVTNISDIIANNKDSIGVYTEKNAKFINKGTVKSTKVATGSAAGSTAIFAKGSTVQNNGIIDSEYMGIYGRDGATIDTNGTVKINSGEGIHVESAGRKQ